MARRLLSLTFACALPALLLLSLLSLTAVPGEADAAVASITPSTSSQQVATTTRHAQKDTGELSRVIVRLKARADLDGIDALVSRSARQREVIRRLQSAALDSQTAIEPRLRQLEAGGRVANVRPFWITNAVALLATDDAFEEMAAWPEVASVTLEHEHYIESISTASLASGQWTTPTADSPAWGVARVRAPAVWHGLGVDGAGVTVAIVDTGVDWLHPDLAAGYRGLRPDSSVDHASSYYNVISPTILAPYDDHGHGTHVAGTAVGRNGLGVAPGAQWIAVTVADSDGLIYESSVHAGLQWLLAPDGRPELAPDIVNGSWGTVGSSTVYLEDIQALQAAGIVTVFAAGNTGPRGGTMNAPASYPGVIAVGAVDDANEPAWFSSRGPSPLTGERKPDLVAPGTAVVSAAPGGGYAVLNGTSMAAPHVAGISALLLSARPDLEPPAVLDRLTETTTGQPPDGHAANIGWGRVDSFSAAGGLVATGHVHGRVVAGGAPLAGAAITVTTTSGAEFATNADNEGRYAIGLRPGAYDLTVAMFGIEATGVARVEVEEGRAIHVPLLVQASPSGTVAGTVEESAGGRPLAARVEVRDARGVTVRALAVGAQGRWATTLPAGPYEILLLAPGHRTQRHDVSVVVDQTVQVSTTMQPEAEILLVDSGRWKYRSYVSLFAASLERLGYPFDVWQVKNPLTGAPSLEQLEAYDAVIWSAPEDSPGQVQAGRVISDYLSNGGRLLLSGQNVAELDGNQQAQGWWSLVGASYAANVSEGDEPLGLIGTGSGFEGISLTLNGPDGARNQLSPDAVWPIPGSLAQPVLQYASGLPAGVLSATCEPYRLLYFGFGLEGVSGAQNRDALLGAGLKTLFAREPTLSAIWQPSAVADFTLPGERYAYTVTLRNTSRVFTETFRLHVESPWATELVTPSLTLGPCQTGRTSLALSVPAGATPGDVLTSTLAAFAEQGGREPLAVLPLRHKIPGGTLLVDDDRFFNVEQAYIEALAALGTTPDVWETGWGDSARGSPPLKLLRAYDRVLWFTGYDWYEPLSEHEVATLEDYLAGGGRLLLSSQDFLFANRATPLAHAYFGTVQYAEAVSPTVALSYGLWPGVFGEQNAATLEFGDYQNFGDALILGPEARSFFWHDAGIAAAAASGYGTERRQWRAIFMALPFEALPASLRNPAMRSIVGWLSDLGDSTYVISAGRRTPPADYVHAVRLTNSGAVTHPVAITLTLPPSLSAIEPLGDGIAQDAASGALHWTGLIGPYASHLIEVPVRLAQTGTAPVSLTSHASISYRAGSGRNSNAITFNQTNRVWRGGPELAQSELAVESAASVPSSGEAFQTVTTTLLLRNEGPEDATEVTATMRIPKHMSAVTPTLGASSGGGGIEGGRLVWRGSIDAGAAVTVTLALTQPLNYARAIPFVAVLDDGVSDLRLLDGYHWPVAYFRYTPLITSRR